MEFEEAVRRNPDLVPALVNLGHVKLVEGRWADAATQFEKALSQEPRWGLLRFCWQRRKRRCIFLNQLLQWLWSRLTVGVEAKTSSDSLRAFSPSGKSLQALKRQTI